MKGLMVPLTTKKYLKVLAKPNATAYSPLKHRIEAHKNLRSISANHVALKDYFNKVIELEPSDAFIQSALKALAGSKIRQSTIKDYLRVFECLFRGGSFWLYLPS
jgi:DNA topoisomerase IA